MTAASTPLRKGAVTRNRILTEALSLFAEKGVEGTSIRDIALAVGIVDAALYRHFRSKDEIVSEVFLLHYGALAEAVAEIGARTGEGGSTVHLRLDCSGEPLAVRLTARSVANLALAAGKPVYAIIKSVSVETP